MQELVSLHIESLLNLDLLGLPRLTPSRRYGAQHGPFVPLEALVIPSRVLDRIRSLAQIELLVEVRERQSLEAVNLDPPPLLLAFYFPHPHDMNHMARR